MVTINLQHEPGEKVFVVINNTRVEAGSILNVKFKVYEEDDLSITTKIFYTVILDDVGEGTVVSDSSNVFLTLEEATDNISEFLTPTPTITPTVTPTTS